MEAPTMNIITTSVAKHNLIRRYLDIVNILLQLSTRELDVLALLIDVDINWNKTLPKNVIDVTSRKYVMTEALIGKANLSRYIHKIKKSGALIRGKDGWVINSTLVPIIIDNTINVHFTLLTKNGTKTE